MAVVLVFSAGLLSIGMVFLLSNSKFLSKSKMIAIPMMPAIMISLGKRRLLGIDRGVFFMEVCSDSFFYLRGNVFLDLSNDTKCWRKILSILIVGVK